MKAKFTSGMKLNGKFGDLVIYDLNGKTVARTKSEISKEEYKTGKNYEPWRKEQTEFSQASIASAAIRYGLEFYKDWQDSTSSGRLTGLLNLIIKKGRGVKGRRSLERQNLDDLRRFELNERRLFGRVLRHLPVVEFDRKNARAEFKFKYFSESYGLKWSPYAKSVCFTAGLVAISEVHYDEGCNRYFSAHPLFDGFCKYFEYEDFIKGEIPENFQLTASLDHFVKKLPKEVALLAILGIEFDNGPGSRVGRIVGVG